MATHALRFMADECCDFAVVRALRALGYDVYAVSETMQQSVDRLLIEMAVKENRILLTEDKDFGWLVYASNVQSAGVVLIRYPGNAREKLGDAVVRLVQSQGEQLTAALSYFSQSKSVLIVAIEMPLEAVNANSCYAPRFNISFAITNCWICEVPS